MTALIRRLPALLVGVLLIVSGCGQDNPTSSGGATVVQLRPGAPLHDSYPDACTDLETCVGQPATEVVAPEELRVCKKYPVGTSNPPAVQVKLDVITHNVVGSPTNITYTVQPNACLKLWWSPGKGKIPDTLRVEELPVPGYTTQSQVSTGILVGTSFVTTPSAPTSATVINGVSGGNGVPGLLVVFTNTPIPPEPELVNIGDFVWNDLDADGIQDAGEPGIPGVPVMLSNGANTVTDANGQYAFTGVPAGTYTVTVAPPVGYVASPTGAGTPSTDSNGGGSTITVVTGTDNTSDFGFYKLGSLGDFVWNDLDADGVQDAGEPGISGVTVNLSNGATTTTNASGGYAFGGLLPGSYTVTVLPPAGFLSSPTGTGTPSTDSNGNSASATISGNTDNTLDFGYYRPTPSGTCVAISAVQGVPIAPVSVGGSGGTGGPYTFSATGLPTGLSMATNGTISGTPTASGSFTYAVTVKDKDGNAGTFNCTVVVSPPPAASCVVISAVQGAAIAPVTLTGTGGAGAPYTFSATGLPAGLAISTGGTISGTPTVSGTFGYTVTVKDKDGNAGTLSCSVTVSGLPSASCVAISAVQGTAIAPVTLTGTGGAGGPYTFTATGLPTGLSISTSGTISGTPTVNGTFGYTVTVKDKDGNAGTLNCSVTVGGLPSASCVAINAVKGAAIAPVTLTGTGGAGGPYTFSATGLPAGLSISTGGIISGTPTVSGSFSYTVTVKDKDNNAGTFNCSVTVGGTPTASCVAITAIQGKAIAPAQLVGSGGAGGPYTFSATGLPAGLTISQSGVISGTPTVSGSFTYTVTVTDKNGNKGTFQCTIVVGPPVDNTAPVCSVFANATPAYMTYQDGGSGIVRLDVTTNLNSNYKVTVSPLAAGTIFSGSQVNGGTLSTGTSIKFLTGQTGQLKVTAVKKTSGVASQLTIKATDASGNTVTCDPIETTVTSLKQDGGNQTFYGVPYEEHFVTVENGGLKSLEVEVNGTTFKIKRLNDDEVRTIDISSAMKKGNNNTITLIPKGKKGETADITIGPDKP